MTEYRRTYDWHRAYRDLEAAHDTWEHYRAWRYAYRDLWRRVSALAEVDDRVAALVREHEAACRTHEEGSGG